MKTHKPYFNRNTGTWEGLPAWESRTEKINALIFDNDGDEHTLEVEYEVENESIVVVTDYDKEFTADLLAVQDDIRSSIEFHERKSFDQINFL